MFVSSQTNHKVTAYSSFIPVLTRFKCQDIRLTRSSTIYADKRVANKRLWPSNNFRLRMYLKSGYIFSLSSFTYGSNFRIKRSNKFSTWKISFSITQANDNIVYENMFSCREEYF